MRFQIQQYIVYVFLLFEKAVFFPSKNLDYVRLHDVDSLSFPANEAVTFKNVGKKRKKKLVIESLEPSFVFRVSSSASMISTHLMKGKMG